MPPEATSEFVEKTAHSAFGTKLALGNNADIPRNPGRSQGDAVFAVLLAAVAVLLVVLSGRCG
jgi:hypothetical protein